MDIGVIKCSGEYSVHLNSERLIREIKNGLNPSETVVLESSIERDSPHWDIVEAMASAQSDEECIGRDLDALVTRVFELGRTFQLELIKKELGIK